MSLTTFLSNSDAKTAPNSSRRGNDTCFNGATLVLEVSKFEVISSLDDSIRIYNTPAKALSEESENK
ncbi:hypothetical protein FF38_01738 [Lucilia cuprina]|uniref:Uncharacterized protein n=1 Tax=Lucilia cuprina TaxID=7375 RepID=A0A0L0BYN3_LUCCU|nr:hypothetical protein FF38_01738 [Lucilia cuprina]